MDLLIRAGRVITAAESQPTLIDQGIAIEDGVITAVDRWASFGDPQDVPILDARAFTVMPGLIDAHTHVVNSGRSRR